MADLLSYKKILITGAAGRLARLSLSLLLQRCPRLKVIGVDSRPLSPPEGLSKKEAQRLSLFQVSYTRGPFESLFRDHHFDAVLHLGRMSHTQADPLSLSQRLDLNLMGTNKILDLCLKNKIHKLLVLSTYHVYGALNDNPVFIAEEAPLRASIKYPELRDVVEMDQICTNWMWKNQNHIETLVLRPCSIIGPQMANTMTRYLKAPYAPVPVDFNPSFQFIHEEDMAHVLIEALEKLPLGVFNVASDETISLREAKIRVGQPAIPTPLSLVSPMAGLVERLWGFPRYLFDYLKFSCIVSNEALKTQLPELKFSHSIHDSLDELREVETG